MLLQQSSLKISASAVAGRFVHRRPNIAYRPISLLSNNNNRRLSSQERFFPSKTSSSSSSWFCFQSNPSTIATTIHSSLAHRNMSTIKRIGVDANPNMSSAVIHNGILTTMGVIDTTGTDIVSQTNNILSKIDDLLKEGGTDRSKLLTANIWLKDIQSDFGTMNEIWVKWIDAKHKPIRACVEANMALPTLLIEIQVTAAV